MDPDLRLNASGVASCEEVERRGKPRAKIPFVAKVRSGSKGDGAFEVHTVIDDISTSGLYMRIARPVEKDDRLFIVIYLSTEQAAQKRGGRIAIRGQVMRTEPRDNHLCGVAVKFTRFRFL